MRDIIRFPITKLEKRLWLKRKFDECLEEQKNLHICGDVDGLVIESLLEDLSGNSNNPWEIVMNIINAKINKNIAITLESQTGVPAEYWINIQKDWDNKHGY